MKMPEKLVGYCDINRGG